MTDRVRVLFVHGTLEIGGAEEVRLALLGCLDRSRYEVTVCCLQRGGAIADEVAALGYEVVVLGHRAHALSPATLWALRRLLRDRRPHIVQTSLPRANYWGRLAAALERVPVIIAEEHTVADKSDWARPVVERVLGPRTDCVIAVSESVRAALVGRVFRRRRMPAAGLRAAVVIPNPVNAARMHPLRTRAEVRQELGASEDEVLVMHTGRMDRVRGAKGHDLLIEAMAMLPACLPDRGTDGAPQIKCFLLGDGPARPPLETLARKLRIAEQVRFLGCRRDVADFLAAADLFALPSRCEGMPIALMEAMWMGLPVIASDIPANQETTGPGDCAQLVAAESPDALARAIAALAGDQQARVDLGLKGRSYARSAFSPERYATTVSGLWQELLAVQAAGTPELRCRGAAR